MVKYKALSIQKWRLPLAAINLKTCTTNKKKQKNILIRWLEINNQSCVTSQKNEDFNYTEAEA